MPALPPDDHSHDDYTSTARFLANPPPDRHSPVITAPTRSTSTARGRVSNASADGASLFPRFGNPTERVTFGSQWPSPSPSSSSLRTRLQTATRTIRRKTERVCSRFTPQQRGLLTVVTIVSTILGIVLIVFSPQIFSALVPVVKAWRNSSVGWLFLWLMVFGVSFPPMIGYSTCVTLAGFVFGVWQGYLIVASATVVGSTAAFLVSRHIFKDYVERLTGRDKRFAALSHVIERDGLKLLVMIRLCPLPYSLSNGAMSTIPSVTMWQFALAGAVASPKLLIGIFIGSRLGDIAEDGENMDTGAKVLSYISIAFGAAVGIWTGWIMYRRTMQRASEIEQEERNAGGHTVGRAGHEEEGVLVDSDYAYTDDGSDDIPEGQDGISLHTTADDDGYRDEYEDDGADAGSLDAVFQAGDGDDSDAEGKDYQK